MILTHHNLFRLALAILLFACTVQHTSGKTNQRLSPGQQPPPVRLSGEEGGRVDGDAWSSNVIKGKVTVLFYVDPDERDLNEHVAERLKAEELAGPDFQSIVVINMAATWVPNWILNRLLKRKQKKFPLAVYVKDEEKTLVEQWGLPDESYTILLFAADGSLRYKRSGRFSADQTARFIDLTKQLLQQGPDE